MTDKQREIFTTRKKEWSKMLEQIEAVNLSEKWTGIFTALCLDRGFRRLQPEQLGQMQHIAEIDSQSVSYLAQADKKAGLTMLERISVEITDEPTRSKAVHIILEKGIKKSQRELDLIISMANSTPSLFDQEATA